MSRERGRKVLCACGRSTQSKDGVCLTCQRVTPSLSRPCVHCEVRNAVSRSSYCRQCRGDLTRLNPEDVLTDGQWVRRGLIVVWEPTPTPPMRLRALATKPPCSTEPSYQWHRHNDPDNWPLPTDDPCGCRAAHRAHEAFRMAMRKERPERKSA